MQLYVCILTGDDIMERFLPFVTGLTVSLAVIPLIIVLAKKFSIIDRPNGRKIHKKPIPLLGGLGLFMGFITSILIYLPMDTKMIGFVISSFIIVVLGILDDIYDIKARKKLVIQVFCSLIVIVAGIRVDLGHYIAANTGIAYLVDIVISLCWIIGIINALNLIDGLDGLAGGVSLVAAVGFIFISVEGYIIAVALAGAILGFLAYNRNPAKIFMGDTGSTFLGFTLGVLSIMSVNVPTNMASLIAPIIILAVPIFDTGVSISRRIIQKRSIFDPDKEHLHHKLLAMGLNQKKTVFIMNTMAFFSMAVGVIINRMNYFTLGLYIIGFLMAVGILMSVASVIQTRLSFELAVSKKEKLNATSDG
jgi:UDP-GlcNAc:undecaprenyl-phosphate GlcNAc-1-phosphate transferase